MKTDVEAKIQQLTGCTSDEYAMLQNKLGMAYLNYRYPDDIQAVQLTSQSRAFWLWYRNQWDIADIEFIGTYIYHDNDPDVIAWLREEWVKIHQPINIKAYPGRYVLLEVWGYFKPKKQGREAVGV